MVYSIAQAQPGEQLPMHLLLLGDENQQLIDQYLPHSDVYLLKDDKQIQGICLVQTRYKEAEIMNVAIEPLQQGQGLGKALLTHVLNIAHKSGLQKLIIKTGNSGIGQIALYQQLGFNLTHVNYNYFLKNYSVPIWENRIQCKHQLVFEFIF